MLTVIRNSGEVFHLVDHGIKTLNFTVDSPEPRAEYETIEGMDGVIDLGATYGPRTMAGEFFMTAADVPDFVLFRNAIFRIFASLEPFYLIDEREPGKRWLVRADKFSPAQVRQHGRFTVGFTSASPYAESVNTTATPQNFDADYWQIGGGLIETDDIAYTHTTTTFALYNAGDIAVDPRRMPLRISYTGEALSLEIRNLTTLDTWKVNGIYPAGTTLEMNGTRSLLNGTTNVFADTNRKLITLAPGWNEFELAGTGAGSFTVEFDFRFYFI
ncbi:MAG: phage tail family protein [Bacillota bacterium]